MKLRAKFDPAPAAERKPQAEKAPRPPADAEVSPAARNLALAHHLARLIDNGVIADYGQAAQMLGVSQPRVTHLMSLLLLAPEIQEAILLGRIAPGDKELRRVARIAEWPEQLDSRGNEGRRCPLSSSAR